MTSQSSPLATTIAGISLKNPVLVASGTFGCGDEYAPFIPLAKLGAIIVKGISLHPAPGNPPPRLVEVRSGLINAIGLQNPGIEAFAKNYLPTLLPYGTPVIVNIWGKTIAEYTAVAQYLNNIPGIAGLELNVSCPNIKEGGQLFGTDPQLLAKTVASVAAITKLPLVVKLAPNVPNIATFAQIAADNGANALAISNTFPAMAINVETRRPLLGNVTGGLSGPAIHPIAVKLVWDAARSVKIPIIAGGGIYSAQEALEFLIAGASAVSIGSANFLNPLTALEVIAGLEEYRQRHNLKSLSEISGSLQLGK